MRFKVGDYVIANGVQEDDYPNFDWTIGQIISVEEGNIDFPIQIIYLNGKDKGKKINYTQKELSKVISQKKIIAYLL